jgi:LacI family transcriptional regulator
MAASMAVEVLLELGHKSLAVIGGHRDDSGIASLRYRGCVSTLQEHGIPFSEDQYETARFTFEEGYRAAIALLERNPSFTALFAMSDVMALGAIRALADAGKRVPEDISVIGFDGLQIGAYTLPRLSTVAQSVEQMAERSVDLLLQSIEKGADARHEVVPVQLQLRESVRKQ